MRSGLALATLIAFAGGSVDAQTPVPPPVSAIVDGILPVGNGLLPVFVSEDWSQQLPKIHRVVIVIHGYERNAADYARNMMALGPPADTLVVAPQFLSPEDIAAHHLPDAILRWQHDLWSGGSPADSPAAVSSFAALDAVVAKTADRTIFPNLSQIVVAGFSAGGQVVQRYAIVSQEEMALIRAGIRERYVVGSPSSYAYFNDDRPRADGSFGAFAGAATCAAYNRWKYGFAGDLPPYVAAVAALGIPGLERRYAMRDIVYLVGANDTDPNHRRLDKSCAGEAQGPNRFARMQFFLAEMKQRDGDVFKQHMWIVDDAAHNAAVVLGSPCGRAALFGDANCSDQKERK
jgi:pimeloyl-ACP methyl ester carboxylesterase